mmetsp:Transcript_34818/g.42009  ORF Transcript_34818/g.42009 Transcript_34818/m.42009 type:complete len:352 (+) Transcript_34818:867-1922(+)
MIRVAIRGGHYLTMVVGGDTTHVVVHSWDNRDGLLGNIDTSKDGSSLGDTRETLGQHLRREMVQVQVDVVILRSDTASLTDLHGHRAADNVTRGKILSSWCITLHETLALTITQDTTFPSGALSNQAASTIDACWMELHKLQILEGEPSTSDHCIAVSSAGMCRGGREVGTSISTGCQDSLCRLEAMNCAVLHTHCDDTNAVSLVVHNQVKREILDKELGVVLQSLAVQGVEHRVPSAIGSTSAAISLATVAKVQALSTKSALVDFTFLCAGEWQSIVLQLQHCFWRFTAHVLNGVLITKPVATLDGIIRVPTPVVFGHISESSIDPTLSSNGVRASGEQLCDARCFETVL